MTPKILHINNYPGQSGADLAFRTTVELLKKHTDFTNWTGFVTDQDDADVAFDSWEDRRGAGKLNYIYSPANRARLASFLDENRPDIVHAHGFYAAISPSILPAIEAGKRKWGMKFVQTAHSHELVCSNASAFDYTQNRICTDCKGHQPKLKIFYRNCDHRGWIYSWVKGIRCMIAQVLFRQVAMTDTIICPSELMMMNLRDEGIEPGKLALIRTPLAQVPPGYTGSDRQEEVVYFGRFSTEKNLTMLIDAFGKFAVGHPDWKLVLIGDGPERENVKAGIDNAGLSQFVEILPFLDQDALFERISRSRIMVMMSSVLENWPLVIPEAVMCGLYPVVPGHGGMREAIEWLGVGSCYDRGDISSLVGALESATHPTAHKEQMAAAQQRINLELGAERYAREIGTLYSRLLES